MNSYGITIYPPNINKSKYTFSPNVEKNEIIHGLSGITGVGEDLVKQIILNRPYETLDDFLQKNSISKPKMVNLIKSGCFDDFGDRKDVLKQYIISVSNPKKKITLQNMRALIDYKLLPPELDFQTHLFNFNKYIKKNKDPAFYFLDELATKFYSDNFDFDKLIPINSDNYQYKIDKSTWDKIYKSKMVPVHNYLVKNQEEILNKVNELLSQDLWNKYCLGNISKWEMDSVSYYSHSHELEKVSYDYYNLANFDNLPPSPIIDRIITIKGKKIPLFQIFRICGTVLDKDKTKNMVTILTKEGSVVVVKIYGDAFSKYDKQISRKDEATGKKKVIEKSWFTRGNKIIVTGIKRETMFFAKKYARTPYHLIEKIAEVAPDGQITTQQERLE
jgi:DNA polymerase-3 subunit alpha